MMDLRIPITDCIHTFLHCGLCVDNKLPQKIEVGITSLGLQVWCARHNVNVFHVSFAGYELPFNDTAAGGGSVKVGHSRNGKP
jgi:hypothetical protein